MNFPRENIFFLSGLNEIELVNDFYSDDEEDELHKEPSLALSIIYFTPS